MINLLIKNIHIFDFFSEVYVFGSILKNVDLPNDIDLLLVYDKYSEHIYSEEDNVFLAVKKLIGLRADLTILSRKELLQTKFLKNLKFSYKKIK